MGGARLSIYGSPIFFFWKLLSQLRDDRSKKHFVRAVVKLCTHGCKSVSSPDVSLEKAQGINPRGDILEM